MEDVKQYFQCKIIFGLAITSVSDFIKDAIRYKAVQKCGIGYVTANTMSLPKDEIIVFDSLREFIRFVPMIQKDHIIVVSEVPALLKNIPDLVPLDFDNQRSFVFNFKPIDYTMLLKSIRSTKFSMKCRLVGYDNIGYHVNRVKSDSSEFLNAYMAVLSNLPFDARTHIRVAVNEFFMRKRVNSAIVTAALEDVRKKHDLGEQIGVFTKLFKKHAEAYHKAVNHEGQATSVAKEFDVDAYAVSFFRNLRRSLEVVKTRNVKNNVKFKAA